MMAGDIDDSSCTHIEMIRELRVRALQSAGGFERIAANLLALLDHCLFTL
jgi:hypothetical protein